MRFKLHGKWKRRYLRQLFKRAKGKCPKCDSQLTYVHGRLNEATLDHIIPESGGGPTTKRNLQLLCARCNGEKSDTLGSSEVRASAS